MLRRFVSIYEPTRVLSPLTRVLSEGLGPLTA
jgi:hypothetical protein